MDNNINKLDILHDYSEDLIEYRFDDIKVDEIILYKDINNNGRLFAGREIFNKFGLKLPDNVITYGYNKIYELLLSDAINILSNSNNDTNPYIINYKYLSIKDYIDKDDTLVILRDSKRNKYLYIRKDDYDKYGFNFDIEEISINDLLFCSIDQGDLSYIIGCSKDDRFDIEYQDVDIDIFKMKPIYSNEVDDVLTIYRNSKDNKLYIDKEAYDRLYLNFDVDEVIINNLLLYEIDEDDYVEIIRRAGNKYSPYKVVISKVMFSNIQNISEDEIIPGTIYRKPRVRGINESEVDYVNYLEEYYNDIFNDNKNNLQL